MDVAASEANPSINQTLSLHDSYQHGHTHPDPLSLFFGGAGCDFSLAIIIGVVVGTSSIFIASPKCGGPGRGRGTTSLRREVTEKATAANPLAQR